MKHALEIAGTCLLYIGLTIFSIVGLVIVTVLTGLLLAFTMFAIFSPIILIVWLVIR
jgi:hypothetical protein